MKKDETNLKRSIVYQETREYLKTLQKEREKVLKAHNFYVDEIEVAEREDDIVYKHGCEQMRSYNSGKLEIIDSVITSLSKILSGLN
jgi:hypothetical protein